MQERKDQSGSSVRPVRKPAAAPASIRALAPPGSPASVQLLALQRVAGNRAVSRAVEDARHEHGAGCGHGESVQPAAAEQPAVQRSTVQDVLSSPGKPVDSSLRSRVETELNADFGDVRMHTDAVAQRSAAEIGARAYTSANHVVVGQGGADLPTLIHEFTHVVQQRAGRVPGTDNGSGLQVSDKGDWAEREATANENRARAGQPVVRPASAPELATPDEAAAPAAGPAAVQGASIQRASSGYGRMDMDYDYDDRAPRIVEASPESRRYGPPVGGPSAYPAGPSSYAGGAPSPYPAAGPSMYSGGGREMEWEDESSGPRIVEARRPRESRTEGRPHHSHRHRRTERDDPRLGVGPRVGPMGAGPSSGQQAASYALAKPSTRDQLLSLGNRLLGSAKSRIHLGAANQAVSAARGGGFELARMLQVTRNKTFREKLGDFRERLGQDAAAAEATGVGNCGEHAAMVFCLLNKERLPSGVRIWYVSLSIDHAFVAVGNPDDPGNIVILDAWQDNTKAVLARDFTSFEFLTSNGGITRQASRFTPNGRDYLSVGRRTIDMAALTNVMDSRTDPVEPESYGDLLGHGMYRQALPPPPVYEPERPPAIVRVRPSKSKSHHRRRKEPEPSVRRAVDRWFGR